MTATEIRILADTNQNVVHFISILCLRPFLGNSGTVPKTRSLPRYCSTLLHVLQHQFAINHSLSVVKVNGRTFPPLIAPPFSAPLLPSCCGSIASNRLIFKYLRGVTLSKSIVVFHIYKFHLPRTSLQVQPRHRHRQVKPPRSRASRIYVQDSVLEALARLVGMPAHNN